MDPDPPVRCWSGANVFNDPRICDRVVEVTVAPGEAPRGRSPGAVDPPGSTSAHVIDLTADGCPRPGSPDGAAQPGAMDWDRRPGADGWAPGTAGAGQDGGREAKSAMYYVHSAHLALASDYFRCLLERWGDPADPGGPIRLTLAPEEAAVVAPLLEFAHGGRLPAHLKPPELLSLLKLADKYGVGALVERSAAALLEMERGLGLEVLIDCLDLADRANISDNVLVRRLLDLCDEALIDAFGDLEEVWACEDSRQRFLELPIQAVRCLLASSRLRVATENTVFVAVTAWLRGRFPGGMAGLRPEEGEEYRRCARELAPWVRFPQLSNTFLAHVAACVEWFQSLECHQYLWEEAMKFKVACPEKQAHVATRVTRDNRYLPRQPSVITGGLSFEWHVSVEDLRGTLDKPPWKKNFLESERHYFGGFHWCLYMKPVKEQGVPNRTVAVYVVVRDLCTTGGAGSVLNGELIPVSFSIAARVSPYYDYSFRHSEDSPRSLVPLAMGFGYMDFFKLSPEALIMQSSKFVQNGFIHLRAEIRNCE